MSKSSHLIAFCMEDIPYGDANRRIVAKRFADSVDWIYYGSITGRAIVRARDVMGEIGTVIGPDHENGGGSLLWAWRLEPPVPSEDSYDRKLIDYFREPEA